MDKCPLCGNEIKKTYIEETFNYKGFAHKIFNYKVLKCENCNNEFVDDETIQNTENEIRDYHYSIDKLLSIIEIKIVKIQKFNLNLISMLIEEHQLGILIF